ncbi:oxidoreductase [Rhizorhapis suberifaciens]|uniref:2,4-dienoyl-CoA reductase-like NADH-dependent reductase (Old Yellow Enzyme family)/thioredoxin reductase n=1 Tax=Rhizorhapis suberifaciens TaxID=13656 RepID=A0A840HSV7_9SPHN|nr:FAD-dependent oxidoreductase [Rhizorhapis suberifaciens]MBB4640648.1 2,4-dienoyl-CoA reductase-like NADH-dependent reductase (Old Yellow Enzyme family)/thioredoxin reductase [Rhizorhapis suberifaciens]
MSYTHVDKPIRLGNLEVKNRTFRPAHGTGIGWGAMTDALIAYHEERARGGVGLIISEVGSVHPSTAFNLDIYKPEIEDGMRAFAERIKRHGTAVFQQLWHAGAAFGPHDGSPPWSASDIPNVANGVVPTPMTKDMIDEIVGAYADCARRMEQYGLDGVDIHGAHGYLPAQFFSPNSNKREDEYGGSFENRARFIMELMRAIRNAVSRDFVVGIRVGTDLIENGLSIEDYLKLTHMLEAEALIDYVNLSVGSYNRNDKMIGGMNEPVGYELPYGIPITHHVQLPTLVTGRFRTLEECDQVIRAGDADMVGLVRATIADPYLVTKSLAGEADRVRPCIACNQACVTKQIYGLPIECAVNAGAGHELERGDHLLQPAPEPGHIVVVGGGPAGLEAARVAALRGHKVTLMEANSHLGGSMRAAAKAPTRHQMIDIVTWLEEEVYRLGVDVQLSTYVDAEDVLATDPDAVIVATGAMERMDGMQISHPGEPIKGVERRGVISSTELFMMTPANLGRTAVVIDDVGHYEGLGSAEFLVSQGLEVTYVTPKREIAPHVWATLMLEPFLQRMQGKPFRFMIRTRGIAIEEGRVIVGPAHLQATLQDSTELAADTVILVSSNRQNRDIYDGLLGRIAHLHLVGDASSPRYLQTAIREGYLAGATV